VIGGSRTALPRQQTLRAPEPHIGTVAAAHPAGFTAAGRYAMTNAREEHVLRQAVRFISWARGPTGFASRLESARRPADWPVLTIG
jgi:hypothetical protein